MDDIQNIDEFRDALNELRSAYAVAVKQASEEKKILQYLRRRVRVLSEAQQIVQVVAETLQNQVHARVASVVTKCLQSVFDDPYEFSIRFERKRGKTEAKLVLSRDGLELTDPLNEAGLGVVEVAAFALRVVALILTMPPKRRLLVLDEPFRFVSREYRRAVRDVVVDLSREMGVQVVMVTHAKELVCGKVIEL